MQEQATLADLKVGDEVAIRAGWSASYNIHHVTKIGPKGVIEIDTGARYHANGRPMKKGDKWYRPDPIEPMTDTIRKVIRVNHLASKLNRLDINYWKTVDLETLEAVASLIWKTEASK